MKQDELHGIIRDLVAADNAVRQDARIRLLQLDEMIISDLIDQFYAGVNETTGIALLGIIGEIGGYEALQLLEDVDEHERDAWRAVAGSWLKHDGRR